MTTANCSAWSRRTCAGTGSRRPGGQGLPAESVLRCAVLKQHRQLSYQELAFHLEDSASFRAFARLPWSWSPRKSVLHKTISAIRAETWEADQSGAAVERRRGEAGARPGGAAGQHGHRGAAARAERQQPAVGCGPGDGASVAGGEGVGCRRRARMARSPAGGEEARPGHPVHPRAAQNGCSSIAS